MAFGGASDVARYISNLYPPSGGSEWRAYPREAGFWTVVLWDVSEIPARAHFGAWTVVGPDGRVFRFASSPQVHDPRTAIEVLTEEYQRGGGLGDDEIYEEVRRRTATTI